MTQGTTLRFDFVHAAALNLGRLPSRLFHFEEHGNALPDAEQVGHARKLVRASVDLHDPPSFLFGYPNNRGDDG
jgi:hypothetical protein